VIDRLVIFGGTGDLTGRYLFPALAALRTRGHLSERFELVGASREDWEDEQFRSWAAGWLEREAPDVDAEVTATLLGSSRYRRIDLADPASVKACLAGEGPVAVYLALPRLSSRSPSRRSSGPGFLPTARSFSRNRLERTSTAPAR